MTPSTLPATVSQVRADRIAGEKGLLLASLKGARMAALDVLMLTEDDEEKVRATTTIAMLDAMAEAWSR